MQKQTNDFFCEQDCVQETTKNLSSLDLTVTSGIIDVLGCGIYIVDYEAKKVRIVSDNIAKMCGLNPQDIEGENCDIYLKYVPDDDYKMLLEINKAAFSFLKKMPDWKILQYSVSYNFHLNGLLLHQTFKPLKVKNGFIKLGLFILTLSSKNDIGNIVMQRKNDVDYYEYSLSGHIWRLKHGIKLSETEKLVLCLSAQGQTSEDIASAMHRSVDTIKRYKKDLFKKMNVKNITEALICAINNRFF
ncbi:MAG: helix-turn-helix transcriptional regulator [Bacteroidales bacterium]|nr:helix-turn-helix transcriptional regulator [Bacteroidales bacterium]